MGAYDLSTNGYQFAYPPPLPPPDVTRTAPIASQLRHAARWWRRVRTSIAALYPPPTPISVIHAAVLTSISTSSMSATVEVSLVS